MPYTACVRTSFLKKVDISENVLQTLIQTLFYKAKKWLNSLQFLQNLGESETFPLQGDPKRL